MTGIDPFAIRQLVPEFAAIEAEYARMSADVRRGRRAILDISYGEHPRQRLDIFLPEKVNGLLPVHLFVHGGYWRAGEKEIHAFPATSILEFGAIAVIVEYALLPATRLGAVVGQVRQAVQWLRENAAEFGGDMEQFSASGHSAGAHLAYYLAASSPLDDANQPAPPKALLLISGVYDLQPISTSFLQPEVELTRQEIGDWSPLRSRPGDATIFDIVVGAEESAPFHRQALDLLGNLERHAAAASLASLAGYDHMTIERDLGRPMTPIAQVLAACIERSRT